MPTCVQDKSLLHRRVFSSVPALRCFQKLESKLTVKLQIGLKMSGKSRQSSSNETPSCSLENSSLKEFRLTGGKLQIKKWNALWNRNVCDGSFPLVSVSACRSQSTLLMEMGTGSHGGPEVFSAHVQSSFCHWLIKHRRVWILLLVFLCLLWYVHRLYFSWTIWPFIEIFW